jgi:hypothetical protein
VRFELTKAVHKNTIMVFLYNANAVSVARRVEVRTTEIKSAPSHHF